MRDTSNLATLRFELGCSASIDRAAAANLTFEARSIFQYGAHGEAVLRHIDRTESLDSLDLEFGLTLIDTDHFSLMRSSSRAHVSMWYPPKILMRMRTPCFDEMHRSCYKLLLTNWHEQQATRHGLMSTAVSAKQQNTKKTTCSQKHFANQTLTKCGTFLQAPLIGAPNCAFRRSFPVRLCRRIYTCGNRRDRIS